MKFSKLAFLVASAMSVTMLQAQTHLGYHSDNYAGIHNIDFQPADIVDGRYQVDINLIGLRLAAGNDYLGLNSKPLTNWAEFYSPDFQKNYVTENKNGAQKNVFADVQLQLPSFSFSYKKHAFAFQSNFHNIVNASGISEQVAYMGYRELETPELWKKQTDNKNLSLQAMGWIDYGLSYGHEVFRKGNHYVKAAGTIKLLQGLYSMQMYSKNAQVSFPNADSINFVNTDFSYGHSSNFERNADLVGYKFTGKPSVGFDLGVVYEWRKSKDKYTYAMDGKDDLEYADRNKYKLKVGAAVCNIGAIDFTRGAGSRSFFANKENVNVNDFSVKTIAQFDSVLAKNFVVKDDAGTTYTQSLPTTINLTADYNVWKSFYANLTASISPTKELEVARLSTASNYSFTARYERKWFGAWIPVTYSSYGNTKVGAGFRLGPIVLGMNDISPVFAAKNVNEMGLYTMLRIPLFYGHRRDKDGDKVSNKFDKCPKEAGTLALNGCPDKDGDGIADADDACPTVAGIAALKGCPDADGDGITDAEDTCPTVAGLAAFKGCPDTDADGITDAEDECPTVAGLAALKGCPDTDGDGITDTKDACPNKAGSLEFKGCPDTDGDKIADNEDACPTVAGLLELKGCPDKDSDGDGINDSKDKCPAVKGIAELQGCPDTDGDKDGVTDRNDACPTVAGTVENKGCPPAPQVAQQAIVNTTFVNLEFETGSDIIRKTSYASLDDLAKMMVETGRGLLLDGHTDDTGGEKLNTTLSLRRANAVKKYLTAKGVKNENVTTQGSAATRPIADNKTAEGRAKNRRVELTLK